MLLDVLLFLCGPALLLLAVFGAYVTWVLTAPPP